MGEQIEFDDASWAEVKVTVIFTVATSAVFLTIYEIARRNPILHFVFDRRRATKPNRTPPPLLRNTIFEWMFVSNDPEYMDYSNLGHMRDVILERRRQRKRAEWSSIFGGKKAAALDLKPTASSYSDDDDDDDGIEDISLPTPKSWKKSTSHHNQSKNVRFHSNVDDSVEVKMVTPNQQPKQFRIPNRTDTDNQYPTSVQSTHNNGGSVRTTSSQLSKNSAKQQRKAIVKSYLTPDVVEVNGRRLPKKIAVYAQAGDLTEEQLDDYEQQLKDEEEKDELDFQRKKRQFLSIRAGIREDDRDSSNRRVDFEDPYGMFDDEREASFELPRRTTRFRYVGFQQGGTSKTDPAISSPTSALGWAWTSGRSLFGTRSQSSRYRLESSRSLSISPTNSDPSTNFVNRHLKSISVKEKRPLSLSDAETLRCVGLDTFVLLRFLRFCFDVTFYPFIVSCLLLISLYVTSEYDGEVEGNDDLPINTQVTGYFRYTINRIEPTDNLLLAPLGFSVFYYFFVLWRLWIEWETYVLICSFFHISYFDDFSHLS